MNQTTRLFFATLTFCILAFAWSCQTEPKQQAVSKRQFDSLCHELDSFKQQYNSDYAYQQVVNDTLYLIATKSYNQKADLSKWHRAGQKIRALVQGYKDIKAVVPFL
jgi:hypothetical protein